MEANVEQEIKVVGPRPDSKFEQPGSASCARCHQEYEEHTPHFFEKGTQLFFLSINEHYFFKWPSSY